MVKDHETIPASARRARTISTRAEPCSSVRAASKHTPGKGSAGKGLPLVRGGSPSSTGSSSISADVDAVPTLTGSDAGEASPSRREPVGRGARTRKPTPKVLDAKASGEESKSPVAHEKQRAGRRSSPASRARSPARQPRGGSASGGPAEEEPSDPSLLPTKRSDRIQERRKRSPRSHSPSSSPPRRRSMPSSASRRRVRLEGKGRANRGAQPSSSAGQMSGASTDGQDAGSGETPRRSQRASIFPRWRSARASEGPTVAEPGRRIPQKKIRVERDEVEGWRRPGKRKSQSPARRGRVPKRNVEERRGDDVAHASGRPKRARREKSADSWEGSSARGLKSGDRAKAKASRTLEDEYAVKYRPRNRGPPNRRGEGAEEDPGAKMSGDEAGKGKKKKPKALDPEEDDRLEGVAKLVAALTGASPQEAEVRDAMPSGRL
jgi:hypothetical protein